jgi:hypothetical protein
MLLRKDKNPIEKARFKVEMFRAEMPDNDLCYSHAVFDVSL